MKKLFLAASLLGALAIPAQADTFNISDFAGSGTFGTFTATANGTSEDVVINMDPNVLIQNGSHFVLTLSLLGAGVIDASSVLFGVAPDSFSVLAKGSYDNGPFKNFTDGITADGCDPAMSIGCGHTLTFSILNFAGFGFGLNTLDPSTPVLAAVDVLLLGGCSGNCTGPVAVSVPGPIVGAGLPGLLGALGLWGFNYRRRNRAAA